MQGEEHIVSLDWDDSSRVSRHVLVLTRYTVKTDFRDFLPLFGEYLSNFRAKGGNWKLKEKIENI